MHIYRYRKSNKPCKYYKEKLPKLLKKQKFKQIYSFKIVDDL